MKQNFIKTESLGPRKLHWKQRNFVKFGYGQEHVELPQLSGKARGNQLKKIPGSLPSR
jgi:hypothetical protein